MAEIPPLEVPGCKCSRLTLILTTLCCVVCTAVCLFVGVLCVLMMIKSCLEGAFGSLLFELPLSAAPFLGAGYFLFTMDGLLSHLTILPEGVRVKYPLRKAELHPWEAFQQVCICYPTSKPGIRGEVPIICFVMHGEKRNLYDRWKTDIAWHVHSLITVGGADELREAVQARCPMEIVDLRNTIPYR